MFPSSLAMMPEPEMVDFTLTAMVTFTTNAMSFLSPGGE